jgi:hypothetical protein
MATRAELFGRLGVLKPVVRPIMDYIFKTEEEAIWRKDLFSSPHGQKWHTSFHSSSFPGDDPKACGRKAIYEMMNIPSVKPLDASVRLMGDVGKKIEEEYVWRFHRAGILLSAKPDAEHQTTIVDEENWLSCSPDAVIVEPKKNRPHPVEIKGKDPHVLEAMAQGTRSFDPAHRNQLLTQVGMVVENQDSLWEGYEACVNGTIVYVDRARPANFHEFKFKYDPAFMQQGRDKLQEWKESYLQEILPPRPREWKWTEQPCKWCKFKPICKEDVKQKVEKLPESTTIAHAKEVRGQYDYEEVRESVLDRWINERTGEN